MTEFPKIKLADKAQLALAKQFGKRYCAEHEGVTVKFSLWNGKIYVLEIEQAQA